MRRRQIFSHLNARDNRAPVPSGAGMGAAAASQSDLPPPVSREEEEKGALIWAPVESGTTYPECESAWRFEEFDNQVYAISGEETKLYKIETVLTPTTDPTANVPKKARGWPKGKKRKP
jgi:hypothetical protein